MRITHSKSSRDAKNYYAFSDYYDAGPSQLKGHWFGRGAALLGLEGEVDKEQFDRLIDNKMPFDDKRLTARNRPDRRVGTDLTFSAPKSVSLLWGVTQDNDILEAVQQAAFETLVDVEQDAQTRVNHERGKMSLERTRNIVGGMWIHTTSRPVDGYPDMNLHAHCFVVNATHADNRWTAVDLSAVVRDSGFYEAVFQSRLAARVQALGYPVERSDRDFEIAGISRETIDKFSRRTALIEKVAAENGITDADVKGKLGAQTRDKKSTNLIPQNELPDKWRKQLTDAEAAQLERIASKQTELVAEPVTASHAVDFATQHCFEREAVIRERQLLRKAILRGIGTADVDAIRAEVAGREWIQEGYEDQAQISTREVLSEEQRLLSFARQGRGQVRPLAENHCIKQDFLSEEQRDAVTGLLNSHDQVQILRGVAGSGKTTMMRETIDAIEQHGRSVTVLAPTAEAAHDVLRAKEGFDADTLASFLVDKEAQRSVKDGVIWVDEAALVGTRDMAKLAVIAEEMSARLILSGDYKQHQPVSRGLPFRLLQTQAGIVPQEVTTIRRQQGEYKDAVELFAQGDVALGLEKLDQLGFVREIEDDAERNKQLACDYADAIQAKQSSLVVAPSNAERDAVVTAIRDELKSRGLIDQTDRELATLRSKRLTEAERKDPMNYSPGDVIEFSTKGKGGFKAGDRLIVAQRAAGRVLAKGRNGLIDVPVDSPKSFDVFRSHHQMFAKGDGIRITKNRRPDRNSSDQRLNNGSTFTLEGFARNGDLKLSNGQTISASWGHIDNSATITSFAAQGKTFDRVFVAQSSLSFPASSPEQAYVSASRGRKSVSVYTDDKVALKAAVSRVRSAMNASDLIANDFAKADVAISPAKKRAEQICLQAHRFAVTQIERFKDWMQSHHQQPRYAR